MLIPRGRDELHTLSPEEGFLNPTLSGLKKRKAENIYLQHTDTGAVKHYIVFFIDSYSRKWKHISPEIKSAFISDLLSEAHFSVDHMLSKQCSKCRSLPITES